MKPADGEPAPEPEVALLAPGQEGPALLEKLEEPALLTHELDPQPPGRPPDQRRGLPLGREPALQPEPGRLTGAAWAAVAVRVGPRRRWVTQP